MGQGGGEIGREVNFSAVAMSHGQDICAQLAHPAGLETTQVIVRTSSPSKFVVRNESNCVGSATEEGGRLTWKTVRRVSSIGPS